MRREANAKHFLYAFRRQAAEPGVRGHYHKKEEGKCEVFLICLPTIGRRTKGEGALPYEEGSNFINASRRQAAEPKVRGHYHEKEVF